MEDLMILVSGGRSSARMARHIQTSPKYSRFNKVYVFCNTGMERKETITFLKNMVTFWRIPLVILEGVYSLEMGIGVRHKEVTFEEMDMEGRVFKEMMAHMNKNKWVGVPNYATPYCSEYLKKRVSHSFAKDYFGTTKYINAIGYRAEDIPKRITRYELQEDDRRIAPLLTDFDRPISKMDLTCWFNNQPFQLEIESRLGNCELCFKKSEKNLVEAIQFGTRFIDWVREAEQEYGNTFYRGNTRIDTLVKYGSSFKQLDLFEDTHQDSCVCSF